MAGRSSAILPVRPHGGVISFTLGAGNTFTYNSNFTSFTAVDINSGTVVLNGNDSAINHERLSPAASWRAPARSIRMLQIFSGGTLAPGPVGGIGTLTITGNLQFFAGSTYQVTISPTQNSKTQDNGTATLGGATVLVAPLVGTYAPHTYTILTDTGGAIGARQQFRRIGHLDARSTCSIRCSPTSTAATTSISPSRAMW